jgi:large subunit ribosomal protein LP2
MRYVAAYLLAVLGANENPSSGDIEKILGSVGIEADAEKLKKVISELSGKSINELIAAGEQRIKWIIASSSILFLLVVRVDTKKSKLHFSL